MAENRITKKWLKNHWAYSWWKYLLAACICLMGINVLFTVTAYRPPEEKKIELYVLNGYIDQAAFDADYEPAFFEAHPDQEELVIMNVNLTMDDPYVRMQYSTYVAAQQGDVMLLPAAEIPNLTADGADHAFVELTPYIESGVINVEGLEDQLLVLKSSEGEEGVYGIPTDTLNGLFAYDHDPRGGYMCLMAYGGNEDTAAAVVGQLIERYQGEMPPEYENGVFKQENPTVFF